MAEASTPVPAGQIVGGKYRVEEVLGVGGMGVVVAATHLQLEQRVALKFMLPEVMTSRETVERFLREARAAVRLKSEHVARIIDVDTMVDGAPYIVMEYLEGTDLAAILQREGALPAPEIADYITQALDALAEAHAVGIVHRDLKPGNLFLTRRADGSALVKILDFGISKAATGGSMVLTRTQGLIGSPAYMSPEQLRASRSVDARSDLWSLGIVMFQMATGQLPFAAEVFSELILQVAMDPLPAMRAWRPLPDGFEQVVRRCLHKDPAQRFQDAAELAAALAPFGPPSAWPIVERIHKLRGLVPPTARPRTIDPMPRTVAPMPAAPTPVPPSTAPSLPPTTPYAAAQGVTVSDSFLHAPPRRSRRALGLIAGLIGLVAAVGISLAVNGGPAPGAPGARPAPAPASAIPASIETPSPPPPIAAPPPPAPTATPARLAAPAEQETAPAEHKAETAGRETAERKAEIAGHETAEPPARPPRSAEPRERAASPAGPASSAAPDDSRERRAKEPRRPARSRSRDVDLLADPLATPE